MTISKMDNYFLLNQNATWINQIKSLPSTKVILKNNIFAV